MIISQFIINLVIENSEIGNKLLTQQLNLIKTNKDKIIKNPNSCKNIIDENLILCFDLAYEGINA